MLMIVKAWVSTMSPAWIEDADIETSVRGVIEEPKMYFEPGSSWCNHMRGSEFRVED